MHISLRRINHLLFALVIAINLYIFTAPFLPRITFWWQHNHTDRQHSLSIQLHTSKPTNTNQPNHIVAPDMLLDTPVLETSASAIQDTLNQGVVHVPASSTPDKDSNTVIIGHRFSYTAPKGIFYYLDKLHPGSEIGLFWSNKRYNYKVVSTREVPPTEVSVEAPTKDARLTLYTCTPLWNPRDRLVVVAELETQK
jgi:sortase A